MDNKINTKQYLENIGMYSSRQVERIQYQTEYLSLSSSVDKRLSIDYFKAHCLARNFTSPKVADVAFYIFDRDNDGFINKHEYYLFRAVITGFVPERDNNTVVIDLRLLIAFKTYDFDNDNHLSFKEIYSMISDMASGPRHILALLEEMRFNNKDIQLSLQDFFNPEIRSKYGTLFLSTSSLLAPKSPIQDNSGVAMQVVISNTNTIANGNPNLPCSFRSPFNQPHTITFNVGIEIENRKKATNSYRGLLVNESCEAFQYANFVIENAKKLCYATANEADISDKEWMTNNEALFALTGSCAIIIFILIILLYCEYLE
jgi:hypothetical protein